MTVQCNDIISGPISRSRADNKGDMKKAMY